MIWFSVRLDPSTPALRNSPPMRRMPKYAVRMGGQRNSATAAGATRGGWRRPGDGASQDAVVVRCQAREDGVRRHADEEELAAARVELARNAGKVFAQIAPVVRPDQERVRAVPACCDHPAGG